jgi:hypothetical protein
MKGTPERLKMKNIDDLKIPLIVSVAGHIDVAVPESILERYFTEFWQQLRKKFGPSTPFVLLSSLAAGADHLAVKYRPADVPYCAVLPFAQELYEKDFTGSALEDFRADLRGAFKTVVCGGGPGDYTAASDYIRTRADIIITLWDGMEALDKNGNVSKGGTYYTVRKVLQLDKLLISSKEKAHLLVNFPVVRRKVYSGGERKIFDSSTWGTLTWDETSGGIRFTPGLSFPQNTEIAAAAGNIRKYNDSLHDFADGRN